MPPPPAAPPRHRAAPSARRKLNFGAPDSGVFTLSVPVQVLGTEATVTEGIRPRQATVSAAL